MQEPRKYDLEDRTLKFAREVSVYCEKTPRTISNLQYCKQVIRSSGSVGANHIEANESLSRKDFLLHIKICRKEAKETRYWMQLLSCSEDFESRKQKLVQESTELMKIFGAIIAKSK
ncbi:MAG: four helix bundle protein [Bacteroidota bacterium]